LAYQLVDVASNIDFISQKLQPVMNILSTPYGRLATIAAGIVWIIVVASRSPAEQAPTPQPNADELRQQIAEAIQRELHDQAAKNRLALMGGGTPAPPTPMEETIRIALAQLPLQRSYQIMPSTGSHDPLGLPIYNPRVDKRKNIP
jgi:hypothetical protein